MYSHIYTKHKDLLHSCSWLKKARSYKLAVGKEGLPQIDTLYFDNRTEFERICVTYFKFTPLNFNRCVYAINFKIVEYLMFEMC